MRKPIFCLTLLLVSPAAALDDPHVIEATTGAPRVDMRGGSPAGLVDREVYERDAANEQFAVRAERNPWKAEGDVLYAMFGNEWGKRWTVAVRRRGEEPPLFLVDLNGNGDLRDEQPIAAEPIVDGGLFGGHRVTTRLQEPDVPLALVFGEPPGLGPQLLVMSDALREGSVEVGGRPVKFAVQGGFGKYGVEWQDVFFDTDGDGEIDEDHFSDERYVIGDEYVNLAGRSWSFGVSEDGGHLTLAALEEKRPDRLRLSAGSPAPDVSFVDIDGEIGKLSDYRGKVLVLYVWGTWCGPCRGETAHLIEAFDRYYERGLEILGVAKRDEAESVRAYVKEHGVAWRQTTEREEGPIVTLYRADAVPNILVIDRDGIIVERSIRGAQLMETLAPMFAASPQP